MNSFHHLTISDVITIRKSNRFNFVRIVFFFSDNSSFSCNIKDSDLIINKHLSDKKNVIDILISHEFSNCIKSIKELIK